jgi:NAD(P)H-flavin reductase
MHPQRGSGIGFLLGLDDDVLAAVTGGPPQRGPFIEAEQRIHWTRQHVWKYNVLLCAALLLIWTTRSISTLRLRRKAILAFPEDDKADDTGSDSSSTLTGTATPPDIKRIHDNDEETPLLLQRANKRDLGFWKRCSCRIRAFLIYQPSPLPIINRSLPDNGTTLFILAFVVFNIVLCLINIPFKPYVWNLVMGDRCGNLFAANLPLLYLLAAKNQPLKLLTGFSYEALNIFHRRLGELLCFLAFVHLTAMFVMYFTLFRPLLPSHTFWDFVTEPIILMGLLSFFCYESLYFTSLGSFRQRWYEIFLASHVLLQIGALAFLWLHYHTSRGYVLLAGLIFLIDRLIYRLMVNTTTLPATVDILEDGQTVMLSADWAIPSHRPKFLGRRSIQHGWDPCAHIFISIPSLCRTAVVQAHPFTIASAAPDLTVEKPYAWLNLLIRAHSGFSLDLLHYAQSQSKVSVRVDGPYGSLEPLHMLEAAEHAILVAGGSGIAVVFPLIWALLHNKPTTTRSRKVTLIWVIHSSTHLSWLPQDRLEELTSLGLNVRIPLPTATHGRPDVGAMLRDEVDTAAAGGETETGIVVSGPDALNRDVRNTCSRLVGEGCDVKITVEKFGW